MTRILITGAGGFVGKHVVARLEQQNWDVRKATRILSPEVRGQAVAVGPINAQTDWSAALQDRDVVVHLAGHVGGRGVPDKQFEEVNDFGTARLVEQVRRSNIRLFINVSTIAVVSPHSSSVIVDDNTRPVNSSVYGRTKHAGEGHAATLVDSGRHAISLRPPIIYGDGAKGNWLALQRLAASGIPLPFGMIKNRRSLLAVENFADALVHLVRMDQGRFVSGAFALADTEHFSTAEIIALLRERNGMSPRLFPFPPALMALSMRMLGLGDMAQSLIGNFQIDSSRFERTFSWTPPLSGFDAILGRTNAVSSG